MEGRVEYCCTDEITLSRWSWKRDNQAIMKRRQNIFVRLDFTKQADNLQIALPEARWHPSREANNPQVPTAILLAAYFEHILCDSKGFYNMCTRRCRNKGLTKALEIATW